MSSRLTKTGKRPISERISIFEQRQTTTTTTSTTSQGIDRTSAAETTQTRSQQVTRVASPVTRTFSGKNFDDLKSAFNSPPSSLDLTSPRSAPAQIRIPGASPMKSVGCRTSVPLSPTQPAPAPLEVFSPPPVVQQRSSVSLNVDKSPSNAATTPLKTPLKKTNSPPGKTKTGSTPPSGGAVAPRGKSAKTIISPSSSTTTTTTPLRPGSDARNGAKTPAGRTPSSGRQVLTKASTTPIKPSSGGGGGSAGGMNINTVTINVKKTTMTELNGNVPGNSTTTTTTKVVRDRAVTAPIPAPPPTVIVTMDQPPAERTLQHSQSLVKIGESKSNGETRETQEVEVVSKAELETREQKMDAETSEQEEDVAAETREKKVVLPPARAPVAVINAPKPIIEEEDHLSDEQPRSPSPVRHQPLKKTSTASMKNHVLNHEAADFVDSIVNNKNRINTHNLVGSNETPEHTPKPDLGDLSSSSGPGSNSANYWANQALLNDHSQKMREVFGKRRRMPLAPSFAACHRYSCFSLFSASGRSKFSGLSSLFYFACRRCSRRMHFSSVVIGQTSRLRVTTSGSLLPSFLHSFLPSFQT
jgi:hypothetical protein